MKYKIYNAIERGVTEVPIELMMNNGVLDIHPDIVGRGYFNVSLRKNNLVLDAGNHVGLIPLNEKVAILVEPKVGRQKWLQIVERAEVSLRELSHLRAYAETTYLSDSILEFLIRALVHQLNEVDLQGMYAQYTPAKERTSFPRGRILFKDSIVNAWSRGFSRSVSVEYYIFTRDIPHNRLLKFAIYLALQYIDTFPNLPPELKRRLDELGNLFALIPLDSTLKYLVSVTEDINNKSLPDTRLYYEDVLKTAILVVQNSGIIPNQIGSTATLSFIVNMETTFEKYCQVILKRNAHNIGEDIKVLDQIEGKIPLFKGVSSDERNAEPDIIIKSSKENLLIVEVKYKDRPNRYDLNQAVTYALAYKTRQVVLLCFTEKENSGWEFLGEVGNQIQVWVYRLAIEMQNLEELEQSLVIAIRDLISGVTNPATLA